MSESFIQPYYTVPRKTSSNAFTHSVIASVSSPLEPDSRLVKMWRGQKKPSPSHQFWNCITKMGNSQVVVCYDKGVQALSASGDSIEGSCEVGTGSIIDIEGHAENSHCVLARSSEGNIHLIRTEQDMNGLRLTQAGSRSASPYAQMCLDGSGSFYCIGDSDTLSVYDLNEPESAVFMMKRQSAGPVSFGPTSQPNILYHACRTYVGIVDLRESSEVAEIVPNPAQLTLTSYSTLMKYSCLATNPTRNSEIAVFSQQHQAVQIFDTRHTRSPVWEWTVPGREYRTEDLSPPMPIRHLEYSNNGTQLLINRPFSFSSYIVSLDDLNNVSPLAEIPTCTSYDDQIESNNARRKSLIGKTCVANKSSLSLSRSLNAMKFVKSKISGFNIEFSIGACFASSNRKIFSISSHAKIYTVSPSDADCSSRITRGTSRLITTFGIPQIESLTEKTIPIGNVNAFLTKLQKRQKPRALYPRLIRDLSNRDKFFFYCITKLVPYVSPCMHHRGVEKSVPGSNVWINCVDKCGYRRPAYAAVDPVGTVHVTTIRQMMFQYNEMFGNLVHPTSIAKFFHTLCQQPFNERKRINPNVEIQYYPGQTKVGEKSEEEKPEYWNPLLFESLDGPAVIVIVKNSRFGCLAKKVKEVKVSTPRQLPNQPKADSFDESDDDEDDLFSQKRPRHETLAATQASQTIAARRSALVVTDLTPLIAEPLCNRYIKMETIDELRKKWVCQTYITKPKYTKRERPPKIVEEPMMDETEEETQREDEGNMEAAFLDTPEEPGLSSTQLQSVRLSELLRGGNSTLKQPR